MALPPDTFRRCEGDEAPNPKARQREEIATQVAEYLARGGAITKIPFGVQTDAEANMSRSDLIQYHKRRTRNLRGGKKR